MQNHSLSVVSLCCRQWSAIVSSLLLILRDEIDFFHCLDFFFIIWLVWNSASNRFFCDFFYVFFRLRSINFHLSIVVSIIAKSLSHTISFHWRSRCDDREMIVDEKEKVVEKRTSIKLCCVVCVSLNRKESENRENSESYDRISI
jgi:hypothetical protein